MIKGKQFVITGLQSWYTSIGSNCKHLAREIAKNNEVLYINTPLDRRTILNKGNDPNIKKHIDIIKYRMNPFEEIQPGFWVYYPQQIMESVNWIPSTIIFNLFNLINNKRLAKDIANACAARGFSDYILFNDNSFLRNFYIKELLKPMVYAYYCRDKLTATPYFSKHGLTLEPRHIAKADVCMANSTYLEQYLKRYNDNSWFIGQGCDTNLFNADRTLSTPSDLAIIKGKKIGYVGVLASMRLDINIFRSIAKSHPEWQVVLVGPEDDTFKASDLHEIPNVHFLGKKCMDELPAYIKGFDVCINPQLVNEMTKGNYPLKIDEYLNMGKPVVATHTLAMEMFAEHVYLADTPAAYSELIGRALKEHNEEKSRSAIAFASKHTWEESASALYNAIEQTLGS